MAPKLYMIPGSPPVRAVFLCAKAIDLELELKPLNLFTGEHLKPEFLKLNPQHTVPTLDDDGFVLWDSHAIMSYLISKYGKDKSLYPEDLKKRAIIDQRMHFDSNVLFLRGMLISKDFLFLGKKEIAEDKLNALKEAFDFVEKFLDGNDYIAGDFLSIADFSFVTSLSSWAVLLPLEASQYPRINAYLKRMAKLPYYEETNGPGLKDYETLIREKLSGNK